MIISNDDAVVACSPASYRFARAVCRAQRKVEDMQARSDKARAIAGLMRRPDILASYQRSAHQVKVLHAHGADALADLIGGRRKYGPKQSYQLINTVHMDHLALVGISDLLDQCERLVSWHGEELAVQAIREALDAVPSVPNQRLICTVANGMVDRLKTDSLLLEW